MRQSLHNPLISVALVLAFSGVAASVSQSRAETASTNSIFLEAVGFALTGSDNTQVKVIDQSNCVFGIYSQVFHLNNVQTDRLKIQEWVNTGGINAGKHYLTVELHGNQTVVEQFVSALKPTGDPDIDKFASITNSNPFSSHTDNYNETTLTLQTSEKDRVNRAWEYVYSHGCAGKKSSF